MFTRLVELERLRAETREYEMMSRFGHGQMDPDRWRIIPFIKESFVCFMFSGL